MRLLKPSVVTLLLFVVFNNAANADETIRGEAFQQLISLWNAGVKLDTFTIDWDIDSLPPRPDYVIQGYQNYKDSIQKYSTINIGQISGVAEFQPSPAFLDSMSVSPPQEAYTNKERAILQHEYKEFFELNGDLSSLVTLTHEGFDALSPGEYFFAVGLNQSVRFGKEMPREEVDSIKAATGKKPARANHAFLFHGAPVLSAGAFWVSAEEPKRIERISGNSGHYFYSNLHREVVADIALHSDRYFKSLAWFIKALHQLEIPHAGVVLTKM